MHAAPARRESAVVNGHVRLEAGKFHASLGYAALPLPSAAVLLVIVEPGADIGSFAALEAIVLFAIFVFFFLVGEVFGVDFLPVADFLDLQDGAGEAFAVDAVFFGEGYAEVADARVVEVLAATEVADVPGCSAGVVFSFALGWSVSVYM